MKKVNFLLAPPVLAWYDVSMSNKESESDMTNKEYKFYSGLILDSIYDDLEGNDIENAHHGIKVNYLYGRITSEMCWLVEQYGLLIAARDFFQGLGVNVPYMNYEILQLAVNEGLLSENATEDQECDFLDAYWMNLAEAAIILFKQYKLIGESECAA